MNEQEIIDYLKNNTSAYCLMPEECQEYLVGKDCESLQIPSNNFYPIGKFEIVGKLKCVVDEWLRGIYRLPADYEPEPKMRYWLNKDTAQLAYKNNSHKPCGHNWLAITKDYYDYLNNKPDCECELRIVKKGDEFLNLVTGEWETRELNGGYRWCKTKPQGKWVEYDVVCDDDRDFWFLSGGGKFDGYQLMPSIVGLAGVCYLMPDGTSTGWVGNLPPFVLSKDLKPATPIKARLWEKK